MQKPSLAVVIAIVFLIGTALSAWLIGQFSQPPSLVAAQTQQVDNLRVSLQLDSTNIGERTITMEVRDAANRPVDLDMLRVRLVMREMDMGTIEVEATPLRNGRYQVRNIPLSMVGTWEVQTTLIRPGQADAQARFMVGIAAPGELAGPINPLAGDSQAVVAGKTLYRANCASCHGESGRGDGPAAAGLKPRPANFTQHMLPGMHTDGQVYMWIEQGYPGSAMPAWGQRLSEQKIWQLVSYLRTFGQPVQPLIPTVPLPQSAPTTRAAPLPPIAPAPTIAPLPTTNEQLPPMVFAREGNIWHSNGAGQVEALTRLPEEQYAQYPAYSPDGNRIVYVVVSSPPITATTPLPTSALYIMNADGSNVEELWAPTQGLLSLPCWSKDGSALYLAVNKFEDSSDASTENILTIAQFDLATRTPQTRFKAALDPTISQDGTKIAYLKLAEDGYTMDLHVAAISGDNDRRVLAGNEFQGFYAPRFSPDGTTIYLAAIGGPEEGAYQQSDDQSLASAPPQSSGNADASRAVRAQPRPSRSLAETLLDMFVTGTAEAHGLPWEIWMVKDDGTDLRKITHIYEDLPMVTFSPDGKQIALMGYNGIYLMNLDGSNIRQISKRGDHGGLDWQP